MRIIFIALHFILFIPTTYAASIKQDIDLVGQPTIRIEGEIVKGDLIKLKKIAAKHILSNKSPLRVTLDSKGGDVNESIEIGKLIRSLLASTYVWGNYIISSSSEVSKEVLERQADKKSASNWANWRIVNPNEDIKETDIAKCYSSCVLIFLSGIEKSVTDNQDNRRQRREIPSIGIHRPYFDQKYFSKLTPAQASAKYKHTEKLVGNFLNELGVSDSLIDRMLKSSSDSLELVSTENFKAFFNNVEPYYEEYMLAKCGSRDPNKFLIGEDRADFYAISKKRKDEFVRRESENPSEKNAEVFKTFIPDGYDEKYVVGLTEYVKMRINQVDQCHEDELVLHQTKWAKSLTD